MCATAPFLLLFPLLATTCTQQSKVSLYNFAASFCSTCRNMRVYCCQIIFSFSFSLHIVSYVQPVLFILILSDFTSLCRTFIHRPIHAVPRARICDGALKPSKIKFVKKPHQPFIDFDRITTEKTACFTTWRRCQHDKRSMVIKGASRDSVSAKSTITLHILSKLANGFSGTSCLFSSRHKIFCLNLKINHRTSFADFYSTSILLVRTVFRLTLTCVALPSYSEVISYYPSLQRQRFATSTRSFLIEKHLFFCPTLLYQIGP